MQVHKHENLRRGTIYSVGAIAFIHPAAEKGYFRKPDEQQGIKKAGIVLSRLLDIR